MRARLGIVGRPNTWPGCSTRMHSCGGLRARATQRLWPARARGGPNHVAPARPAIRRHRLWPGPLGHAAGRRALHPGRHRLPQDLGGAVRAHGRARSGGSGAAGRTARRAAAQAGRGEQRQRRGRRPAVARACRACLNLRVRNGSLLLCQPVHFLRKKIGAPLAASLQAHQYRSDRKMAGGRVKHNGGQPQDGKPYKTVWHGQTEACMLGRDGGAQQRCRSSTALRGFCAQRDCLCCRLRGSQAAGCRSGRWCGPLPGLRLLLQHVANSQHVRVVRPKVRLLDAQRALQQRPPNVVAALRTAGARAREQEQGAWAGVWTRQALGATGGTYTPCLPASAKAVASPLGSETSPSAPLCAPPPACSRWMTAMSVRVCATSGESGPEPASQIASARSYSGSAAATSPRCSGRRGRDGSLA